MEFFLFTAIGFLLIQIPGYFFFPKLKIKNMPGYNGQNNLFEAAVSTRAPNGAAVMAQELAESKWKWLRMAGYPIIGTILHRMPFMKRKLEIWGHEVEVQALVLLYDKIENIERAREARSMKAYDGYYFKNNDKWTLSRIEDEMRDLRSKARKWVINNEKTLRNIKEKLDSMKE